MERLIIYVQAGCFDLALKKSRLINKHNNIFSFEMLSILLGLAILESFAHRSGILNWGTIRR